MEDRLYRGFVAGVIGGFIATPLAHLAYILGYSTLRGVDWTGILLYAHEPPFSMGELSLALFILLGWCGAIGSLFSYLIVPITSRHILFKGWMFGTTPFFVIYLLTTLSKVPGTIPVPFGTALSNYITVSIFSVVMAYSFKVLDLTVTQNRSPIELIANPASKRLDTDKIQYHSENDKSGEDNSNRT